MNNTNNTTVAIFRLSDDMLSVNAKVILKIEGKWHCEPGFKLSKYEWDEVLDFINLEKRLRAEKMDKEIDSLLENTGIQRVCKN